jgi:hypothetical protein
MMDYKDMAQTLGRFRQTPDRSMVPQGVQGVVQPMAPQQPQMQFSNPITGWSRPAGQVVPGLRRRNAMGGGPFGGSM